MAARRGGCRGRDGRYRHQRPGQPGAVASAAARFLRPFLVVLLTAAAAGLLPARAAAQELEDPTDRARFHWGAFHFTPSIAINNLGVDNNVFNEGSNPQSDSTAAFGPAVDLWMHLGRARLSGRASAQYHYFNEFVAQRAWNSADDVHVDLPLTRITPFFEAGFSSSRSRLGYEIDSRARQQSNHLAAGATLNISGRSNLRVSQARQNVAFDRSEVLVGVELADRLDRSSDATSAALRYALTPLTTFVVNTEFIRDRFDTEHTRDADSVRVLPGLEFKPLALISGSVALGFRRLDGLDPSLPDYAGFVASVNTSYQIAATRVQFRVDRDLVYSSRTIDPYYALTDIGVTVTERITSSWDVVGSGGWQSLNYHRLTSATPLDDDVELVRQYGAGVGYRLGNSVRFGLDLIYSKRLSYDPGRDYKGFRAGFSIGYGQP